MRFTSTWSKVLRRWASRPHEMFNQYVIKLMHMGLASYADVLRAEDCRRKTESENADHIPEANVCTRTEWVQHAVRHDQAIEFTCILQCSILFRQKRMFLRKGRTICILLNFVHQSSLVELSLPSLSPSSPKPSKSSSSPGKSSCPLVGNITNAFRQVTLLFVSYDPTMVPSCGTV